MNNRKNNSISDAYIHPFKGYKLEQNDKNNKLEQNDKNNKLEQNDKNNKLEQNDKNNKLEQITACLIYASLFDTIGFGNGNVEFNYNIDINFKDKTYIMPINNYISTEYFFNGGYKNLDYNKLLASDDTILLMATTNALINGGGEQNYINAYLDVFNKYYIKDNDKRYFGLQTIESLTYLNKFAKSNKKNESFIKNIQISKKMGGNGASIRTATIGIKYFNDIDKIIQESLIASRITHNYYIGYLGGVVSALFTSWAYQKISPFLWIAKLIELYENKIINKNINLDNNNEIDDYFYNWIKYKEIRFDSLIKNNKFIQPYHVFEIIAQFNPEYTTNNFTFNKIGSSGLDSVIFAYDSLIMSSVSDSKFNFESLIYFGCLHIGDSDSTGAILGAWYGAYSGFNDFEKSIINKMEFSKELLDISNKLYKTIKE
jgi:ADP-ribosylarginine hydrolase